MNILNSVLKSDNLVRIFVRDSVSDFLSQAFNLLHHMPRIVNESVCRVLSFTISRFVTAKILHFQLDWRNHKNKS